MRFRKRIYFYIALSVFVLCSVGVVTYLVFFNNSVGVLGKGVAVPSSLNAVPADAIAVYCFDNREAIGELFKKSSSAPSKYLALDDAIVTFLKEVVISGEFSESFANTPSIISFHYSGREDISPLFIAELDGENSLLNDLLSSYKDVRKIGYGEAVIYRTNTLNFCLFSKYILVSSSIIVLESSVRHLETAVSVLDNADFKRVISVAEMGSNRLFIDHSQFGKIFAGRLKREFSKYAGFFSRVASWSVLKGEKVGKNYRYRGKFINNRGNQEYCSLFKNTKDGRSEVYDILPVSTIAVLTLSVGDFIAFSNLFREYEVANAMRAATPSAVGADWFNSLNVAEVVLALVPFKGESRFVTLIRVASKLDGSGDAIKIEEFRYRGFLADSFGGVFSSTKEDAVCYRGEWMIIGESDIIRELIPMNSSERALTSRFSSERSALSVVYNDTDCKVKLDIYSGNDGGYNFEIFLYSTESDGDKESVPANNNSKRKRG